MNKVKIIGSVGLWYFIAINPLLAQNNLETDAQILELSNRVVFQIMDFETNASEIETNQSLVESQKLFDEKMDRMEDSIKSAIDTLRYTQVNIDRKQKTILWCEILAAIDRHLDTNFPPVDISGFISPPPGYKGKVGPWGMMPPDTNDAADYAYYLVAVKTNKRNGEKALYLSTLKRINDWNAKSGIEKFLKSNFGSSEAGQKELYEILDQSTLSESRKQQLRKIVSP